MTGAPGFRCAIAPRAPICRALSWGLGVVTIALSLRVVADTARYLSFEPHFGFLLERPLLSADRLWLACFYVHVAGGTICLVSAPLLLWNGLTGRSIRLHRAIGRVHAVAALGWTGPTGLYLAPFAKGGLAGRIGFLVLGVAFCASTVLGVLAIRRRDLRRHVAWMLRSYALILSAVTFRVLHLALHGLGVAPEPAYVVCTWSSLALALAAGEFMIRWFGRAAASSAVAGDMP
ncbi:MAG: DUF2306 domain-containing protein [Planctomycetes bacterium]|nr:DUF2306 domain-containing protein [Planctomycetota bacterium]